MTDDVVEYMTMHQRRYIRDRGGARRIQSSPVIVVEFIVIILIMIQKICLMFSVVIYC